MKRLVCLIFIMVLLCGCGGPGPETVPPTETQIPTQPPTPWIETVGQPWDAAGALLELPLKVPNGLLYSAYMVFDGDLMFWSQDYHRMDHPRQLLCVLDLDTGEILAQKEIEFYVSIAPQILGDRMYLFNDQSGEILELDKQLNCLNRWQTDVRDAGLYMGANGVAYVNLWEEGACALNLQTQEMVPILEEIPEISYLTAVDDYLQVVYYHPDSGTECLALIDLHTGKRLDPPVRTGTITGYHDGTWLMDTYKDSFIYTMYPENGEGVMVDMGYQTLKLMADNRIMRLSEASNQISVHDLSGKALAQCTLSEQDYGYAYIDLIPNETFGGYFVVIGDHDGSIRLLFWEMDAENPGEDIAFKRIPEPSEIEAQNREKVAQLEKEYGLNILIGEEAAGYFFDFQAEPVTDPADIADALKTLEDALQDYPEGFFRQLRYGEVQRTEIHLAGTLTATNEEYVDTYSAFVQDSYDCHIMVMDIYQTSEATYYHEFSHVIDSFLEWDAVNREGALFSDDAWCGLNPRWFPGYTYSYSWEQYVEDYSCFIDSYSTINPTEDRARVLEYAMAQYGGYNFEEDTVLLRKLSYYCRCLRDAFDTSGWPETVLWEQYLP